ncbi:carboxysome shell carbonic anhydrase [Acidithiobacillus sp. CV18-2]|uniref:Carboxysome shell carbonic anhydrase n=1 Tax=Igneacidithiobacillus copahuensis TaxID=2724909 RepID=A0AAE3CKY4_9PROT|nr:carboxysome shell carbonic anhydrase [Igneacidithiobacillus copahuensis]MBU2754119.1 carboxysome shell carbonic anhydrase [Acidithiobacillus sp. CV18-3]MBU2756996.1 carboxysome shell carbonic anhydrase [Acidithiobacillus sp. BN09-2]MBU2777834.1 carboxysome shell carbonic anhydrase [Acidithiobacillus sp. CV18-2]MBU2795581.1 carboxysome shell carbonic anhydrase [Acidithiobacillus sp. VAN18-2]MBU2798809.1 carboxysome shell carbonic anhydrase [Acidithiobacillus sp. VAN18-4]UTV81788.1 carboxyso
MDTRRKMRHLRQSASSSAPAMSMAQRYSSEVQVPLAANGMPAEHPACTALPHRSCRHPLTNVVENDRLGHCEDGVKGRFDAILPVLQEVAARGLGGGYAENAQRLAQERLGFSLPDKLLENAWVRGFDMRALFASATFAALERGVARFSQRLREELQAGENVDAMLVDCGFHAMNLSLCADGRLKGFLPYVLRLPAGHLLRRSAFAGTLFDVERDVEDWQATELRRYREGFPTTADVPTRYLKVAVYHGSSLDPTHQGCAAHGSNESLALEMALQRLQAFREAIENEFCCGASTDILLIGLDTDTDAIRIHVPDAKGNLSAYRYVDNAQVYRQTLDMDADRARLAVYEAIRVAAESSGWGQGEGMPHDGMRRLIATLLINNLSQIEYVADRVGGWYPDAGHGERFISVGDGFQELQMRNVAYYARLDTVEEGAADLDVGIKIFKHLNVERQLPIPMALHYRYDSRVPGNRERVVSKLQRVADAIRQRYAQLDRNGWLYLHGSVQDLPLGSALEEVDLA